MTMYMIYFIISIAAVLVTAMFIVKNIYFRRTGILLFDKKYKPGTLEYKRIKKIYSNRSLIAQSILLPIFIANLVFAIYIIARLPYHGFASVTFTLGLFIVIAFLAGLIQARKIKRFVEGKNNDSWLS